MTLNIAFFSSSDFTLPILKSIYDYQGYSLLEVFIKQVNWLSNFRQTEFYLDLQPVFWQKKVELITLAQKQKNLDLKLPVKLSLIVSTPDTQNREKIYSNLIVQWAKKQQLLVYQPLNINKDLQTWQYLARDQHFSILASFGKILSQKVLHTPKYGFINWHPSALPEYRGPSPMQTVLKDGKTKTGLSWLEMTKEMDAGDIWLQVLVKILYTETCIDLTNRMVELGVNTWALPLVAKIIYQQEANCC